MKGTGSVNPLFQSLQIRNPTIYRVQPLVAADNHRLYFGSINTGIKWQHKSIINCSYTNKYGAVLILCQDGKLYVYNQTLSEISKISWQSKYSVGLQLIQKLNMFLMIGATEVQLQYVKINSNIRTTKFVSSMVFTVEKRDKYIAQPDTKLQWNKGYNYDVNQNLLYLWSSKDINFYSLDKLQLKSHIVSLTKKQLSITYVFFNVHYKYTVTGLINGHIKVWRLPLSKNSSKDYILIHNFIKHSKPIDKIVQGNDDRVIISSSSEMIVCLWSLQTFDLLRQYNFLGQYSKIILLNSVYSLAEKDSVLGKLKFGKTMQFITQITSNLIFYDKYRKNPTLDKKSQIQSIQFTLASNLGFQIRDQQLNSKDLNKIDVQYIYPPLKAKGIQQIITSPYSQNQYYLLVQNGQIFRVRIDQGSGKIQQAYNIQRAKDVQFHQINQNPTIIKFLSIVPPKFDSQINQNIIQKTKIDQRSQIQKFLDFKFLTVGCGKGTVVFFKIDDFQNIYTRVTYHRQDIVHIQSFRSNGFDFLATCCSQKYLKLVKFDHEKATCMLSVYFGPSLRQIYGFQDRLATVFQKGFFDIFQIDENDNEYCIRNMDTSDHEEQLWSLDYDTNRKLILTTAGDNKIKIWTYYKVLVYEVFLDEGLKQAIWFRDLQIILSHNLKILYFKNIGLKITQQQIQEFNSQFLMKNQEKYSIKELAIMMKQSQNYIHKKVQQKEHINMHTILQTDTKHHRIKIQKPSTSSPKRKTIRSIKGKKKSNITVHQQIKNQLKHNHIPETDLDAMKRHLQDIKQIRKRTHESVLPKIKPKVQDNFDSFMKSKLINKKVLTRRDITLNRIIMKNIIKEHFGNDNQVISNLKLDF